MAKSEPAIEIGNLRKSYGSKEVLRGIDLLVKKGAFMHYLGKTEQVKQPWYGYLQP